MNEFPHMAFWLNEGSGGLSSDIPMAKVSGGTREPIVEIGAKQGMKLGSGSAIIHRFVLKSPFFKFLGALRLKNAALVCLIVTLASSGFVSCGYSNHAYLPPSKLNTRVVVSQDINSTFSSGGLRIIDAKHDIFAQASEISAGITPGFMVISPTRGTLLAFDPTSNTLQDIDTVTEQNIGSFSLPAPTSSIAMTSDSGIAYAAVPGAPMLPTYPSGAILTLDLTVGSKVTIGVPNAQTVITNSNGTQLLVFANDSDSVSVLAPLLAIGPTDVGCDSLVTSPVCTIVPGFDRPVFAILNGSTAYVVNCGAECGGTQASIQVVDLSTSPPTLGASVNVNAATTAFLSGTTLYVAGTPLAPNNTCTGQTTAATTCGRLDIVDLGSMTVTGTVTIPDGHHDRIDLSVNGQLFVGSRGCTNLGNINFPVDGQEIRGCLAIFDTTVAGNTTAIIPPDNGDVTGLQSFSSMSKEYVTEGGNLRIYDTNKDVLQTLQLVVVGDAADVKAIDFF